MAANTKVLLAGLEEYYQSLQRHLSQLQQDFQQLDRTMASIQRGL